MLFVRVTAVGAGGRPTAVPANFALVAADGALFGAMWASDHPLMDKVDIGPGEVASSEMLFSVPPDAVTEKSIAYGLYDEVPLGWWALNILTTLRRNARPDALRDSRPGRTGEY
ncbi:hypothetical protein ACWKSP_35785 [Micromonosporaceae bacterium Da 78-11]